ncbi:MAG TPA: hypothetical protein VEC58_00650, partial [Roseiarcus sp.]|nr:hypothetical protein [Roseiarcus sp.]
EEHNKLAKSTFEVFNKGAITIDSRMASELVKNIEQVERIDRLIMSAETRRNNALHEIERHRAGLARISHRRGLVFRDPTMIAQWRWRGRARPWRGLRGWGRSFGGLRWVVGWIAGVCSASRRRVRRL